MKNILKVAIFVCLLSACSLDTKIDCPYQLSNRKNCYNNSLLNLLNRVSESYKDGVMLLADGGEGSGQEGETSDEEQGGTSDGDSGDGSGTPNENVVFRNDAIGFATGFTFAGCEGALVGTVLAPGIGTVTGAIADKLIVGLSTGLVASVVAARVENEEAALEKDNNGESNDWVKDFSCEFLFPEDMLGANIGYYHNWLISNLWMETGDDIHGVETEYILTTTIRLLEENEIVQFNDVSSFNLEASLICANFQNFSEVSFADVLGEYCEVIYLYLTEFYAVSSEYRQQFTSDFMDVIAGYGLSDEITLLLNGTISTYYYSSVLWNTDAIYLKGYE